MAVTLDPVKEKVINRSPKYKVLLHNDPNNTMDYVVKCLKEVLPFLSDEECVLIMLQTHNTGTGLVTVCDFEPAEFYCECLKSKGLTSSIEKE
jgi:ATP-dependent Clp protease adaptor protein ClpS